MFVHHYLVLLQLMILLVWPIKASKDLCQYDCGNVTIIYPFEIGDGCYFDKSFEVFCDYSSGSPKAFLASINNLQVLDSHVYTVYDSSTSFYVYMIRVYIPVISLKISNLTSSDKGVSLSGSPFTFSRSRNRFTAIGCNNYSTIIKRQNDSSVFGGCLSIITCDPALNPGCYDFLCAFPQNITEVFNAQISNFYSKSIPQECHSVSIVEDYWITSGYLKNPHVLKDHEQVPALLEWLEYKGYCYEEYNSKTTCNKDNRCLIQLSSGYLCLCFRETSFDRHHHGYCSGFLFYNITSPYNYSSGCPKGYFSDPNSSICAQNRRTSSYELLQIMHKNSHVKFIIIGCNSGLGMLFLLIGIWWLCKFVKRRREIKLKQKFFKRNGGLLLQQQSSSNEGNTEKTKLFTSMELEMATDNFNTNRILGQGGQGTVYKGMLTDGRIAAVKKSKLVDESNIEQFINEVVILTQINHRNVVKLFGCCLETEVPLLVYEFIPNGTLYQYIHDQTEEFSITWEMRLRIAVEVSSALSYLHSTTSIPIYHRDIKSVKVAKVSDFGASRSVTIDQTHLTTRVQGTFGYLDPEYFGSSQFIEKSDVYSFRVVLVELLTGQKPILSTDAEEDKSLAGYFLRAMKENHLFDVLDAQVLKEAKEEEIITVAMLAKRCLNLNGRKRPTMKEVTFELGGIRAQKCEDIHLVGGNFETGSSSTGAF
ncbi:hypothetical protein KPL71_007947 [Citrus sinensis]|uniref:Uncharacterized protein n=1 Tax=Citrus sinensis TaxID=2711 RepID=A0ACB8M386_CITSI|nr:hypothetical protein KPL71_007947 [Citrus sinensis]